MWAYANNHTIYHKPDNLTFQVWLDKESFWRPSCSLSLRNSLQTAIVFKSENIRPYGYKKKKKKKSAKNLFKCLTQLECDTFFLTF